MEFKVLFVLLLLYNNNCQLHLCFMVDIYLLPSIFIQLNLYIYCFQCCTVISEREEIFSKSVIWKLIFFSKYIRNKEAKRRKISFRDEIKWKRRLFVKSILKDSSIFLDLDHPNLSTFVIP